MPETISPVTREEDYLAAIAGQDVTPPTPVTRKEEWLDLIADKVDDLAGGLSTAEGEIDDLQDIVPTPAAGDSGKVLTAGADGTGSWADVPKELPASLGTAGQVLTVNAGATGVEWATTSGGGGMLVEIVLDSGTHTPDHLDVEAKALYDALSAGQYVCFYFVDQDGMKNVYILMGFYGDTVTHIYNFMLEVWSANDMQVYSFVASSDSANPTIFAPH